MCSGHMSCNVHTANTGPEATFSADRIQDVLGHTDSSKTQSVAVQLSSRCHHLVSAGSAVVVVGLDALAIAAQLLSALAR